MTLNRLITSLVQLILAIGCYHGIKMIYIDVKENGFFSGKENE